MKADCVFLFLFQPFKFKAYFLVLFLMGKNQVAQLESEDLAGMDVLPPGSVPPQSFLWQVLEHSCRLKLMSLGEVKPALEEAPTNVFIRQQHSDLGFMQNYTSSLLRETLVKAGTMCAVA